MAAGGPAGHWLTDILYWKLPAVGEPHDSLIRDIVCFGGERRLDDGNSLGRTPDRVWPPRLIEEPKRAAELEELTLVLQSLRDHPREEAIDGGWEVGELPVDGHPPAP